ncbi:MAG TPA: ABC transporter permease [Hyphomicrobiaceae bacterium]|nr:ABC transporter permease [Hyphomicrobiaceae bacterium]
MSSSSDRPRDGRPRLTQRLPQARDPNFGIDPRTGEPWSDSYTQDPYTQPYAYDQGTTDGWASADYDRNHDPRTAVPPPQLSPQTRAAPRLENHIPEPLAPHRPSTRQTAPPADPVASGMASRGRPGARERSHAPIVQAKSVTGKSLTLVIAIMCFLACLTVGAVYMMNRSASAWLKDIASEVTVQIEAREKVDIEKQLRDVSLFLAKQNGIRSVKPLSVDVSANLLEPWLGSADVLKSLPVPRLIALEIDRNGPPDFVALKAQLSQQFKGVTLDDHRHWQQQIRTVTRSFALGGIAILFLVAAATMAIIVSATRSALAANREIVEVLHFVGATDKFIAREFEKHFLRLGVKAGVFGAVLAGLVFVLLPFAMELLGGGTVTLAELQRLVGTGTLDPMGYGWLAAVVLAIAAICMLTSRIGVKRILHSQD